MSHDAAYAIELGDATLDVAEFRALVATGRRLRGSGDTPGAAEALERALALWRGEPLADVRSPPLLLVHRTALREARLGAREDLNDALLALGRHGELVADLAEQVARSPLRERLVSQLALALHADGRTSDALGVISRHRRVLADRYALDLGTELGRLEMDLLRGRLPASGATTRVAAHAVPAAPAGMVGRGSVLTELETALARDGSPCVVVCGPPGVGKTAVVLTALARVPAEHAVYLALGGTDAPLPAEEVVRRLLVATGIADAGVPAGQADRVALLRARAAGRRLVLVLDDVSDEAQVRPALTARWKASVAIARRPLAALDSAALIRLGPLDPAAAVELLRLAAGPTPLGPDDTPVALDVVRWCGFLPLAVRVAGLRLALNPRLTLTELWRRIRAGNGLTELRAGDLDVGRCLASAYAAMPAVARRAFDALCGAAPSPFTEAAAATVLGRPLEETTDLLDDMLLAQLLRVRPAGAGGPRYELAPMMRALGRPGVGSGDAAPEPFPAETPDQLRHLVPAGRVAVDEVLIG